MVAEPEERILIRRAGPLVGEVCIPGAKNSVLKLMAATLLAEGTYELTNVPDIVDVRTMADLLAAIGVRSEVLPDGHLRMVNEGDIRPVAPYELVERIRASINVLGPLLGRYGERLQQLFAQGKAEGDIDPTLDAEAAATLFIGTIQGLVMQSLITGDMQRMRSDAARVFAIYQRGIAAGNESPP